MSYGLRNTLILLVVLTTFIGAGWSYIYFYQKPKVEELHQKVEKTRKELNQKQKKANQYPVLKNRYQEATKFFNNYNKALYANSNEDNVYDFLDKISTGPAYTKFTFGFMDSTKQGKFGTMTMQVTGQGYYRNFINFIRQIELSKPLNKIDELTINPIDKLDSYGKVNFKFTLKSFYDRVKLLGKPDLAVTDNLVASVYNPFFPLIRSVKKNEKNLVNIEKSSLLAVSTDRVFVVDQNGVMKALTKGEDVYLGELTSINVNRGTASFELNKGGIIKEVTLRVNNEENQSSN